jgi:hypothetical protein
VTFEADEESWDEDEEVEAASRVRVHFPSER